MINNRKQRNNAVPMFTINSVRKCFVGVAFVASLLLIVQSVRGYSADDNDADEKLLTQYVQSKGSGIIVFDPSNIKQFWIDNSVVAKKTSFQIQIDSSSESVPLKIQLSNVNETQDCRIEVVADSTDFSFCVLNNDSKVISTSSSEDIFMRYNIVSATFHLEDTTNLSFNLKFRSNASLEIKRIILSFSDNSKSSFLVSPGVLRITGNDVEGTDKITSDEKNNSFSVSGESFTISSKKKILVKDNELSNNITIKNIGDKPADIYFGYTPYTNNLQRIHNRNTFYKTVNKVFKIISSEDNSNKLIIDSVPEWEKGCYLVLNAKEDASDFPNFSFLDRLSDLKEIGNGHAEITLDNPVKKVIKPGTTARLQAKLGYSHIYTNIKRLAPGEEVTFSSKIKKDNDFLLYSAKAFCRGTYYVVPVIVSVTVNRDGENKIMITDFTVSY